MVVFVRDAAASKKLGGARDYLGNEVLPLKKGQFWKNVFRYGTPVVFSQRLKKDRFVDGVS